MIQLFKNSLKYKDSEGNMQDSGVLFASETEPEYQLIETIVCDGTYGNIVRNNLSLTHAKIYLHTQKSESATSIYVEARNDAGLCGYAWIGSALSTGGERWSRVNLVSDGKRAYCNYVGPVSAIHEANTLYETVNVLDASTPINSIKINASGGIMYPKGTIIEIYGVQA